MKTKDIGNPNEVNNQADDTFLCGIESFDSSVAKLCPGKLLILVGKPNIGKTAFAITAMCNLALNCRIPVAMFSLEMTNLQVARRIVMNTMKVQFPLEQFSETESGKLETQILNKLRGVPIYIDDTAYASIDEIIVKIQELKRTQDVKVFFVDCINFIKEYFKHRTEILQRLKDIASRLHVSLVAICSLSKGQDIVMPSDDENERIIFSFNELTEDYFEIADNVCLLHRPDYYTRNEPKNLVEMYILEKKCICIDKLCLTFRPEFAQLTEWNREL